MKFRTVEKKRNMSEQKLINKAQNDVKKPQNAPAAPVAPADDDEFARNLTFLVLSFILLVLILLMYAWIMRQWLLNPQMSSERILSYLGGLVVIAIVLASGLIRLFRYLIPDEITTVKKYQ